MKKVIIIINSLYIGGGAEKVASLIGNELHHKNYDVHILTFQDEKEKYYYRGKYHSLKEKIIKTKIGALYAVFRRAWKIKQYCNKHNIHTIISFMEEANFASITSKILFKNRTKKIIVSIRNNPSHKKLVARLLIKILYKKANVVIANSKQIEQILNTKYKIQNTNTIYNPINFKEIDKLAKEKLEKKYLEIIKKNYIFINIGRLTAQKNQKNIIQNFKKAIIKIPNAKLLIIGEGKLKDDLKLQIRKLKLEKSVFLLGKQKNVFPFLMQSNCFILSSLWEGMPNVLIEAIYCNLQIISTDCISGPRELLAPNLNIEQKITYPYTGKFGILVKEDFSEEMIKTTKYKKQISKKDLKRFKMDTIIKQWEKII